MGRTKGETNRGGQRGRQIGEAKGGGQRGRQIGEAKGGGQRWRPNGEAKWGGQGGPAESPISLPCYRLHTTFKPWSNVPPPKYTTDTGHF